MKVNISTRFLRVWQRNLTVYRESWKVNFVPPLLEPLFYLLAFGIGFSGMIASVSYASREVSYVQFIAPALVAINIMNNSFLKHLRILCTDVLSKNVRRHDGYPA